MKWRTILILAVLAVAAIASAKSTKLMFTWTNPKYAGGSFKNVLVLAMNGKPSGRAEFEDRLSAAIARPGVQAVPSYSLLPRPDSTPIDRDQLRDVVRGQRFDAIVVSRLVKYDQTTTYVPGQDYPLFPYYGTFYGYYGALYPVVYSPGYLQTDTAAQIETNVYSTARPDGEIVLTITSNTVNPHSLNKAMDAVAKLVVEQLEKNKLI